MSTDQRDDENAASTTIVTSDAKTTTIFHFEGAAVRFVGTAERPEWVARDVCEILGTDRSQIRRLEEYQKGGAIVHTVQGPQQVTTVFEAGLYALIFSSRKETARKFQRWVFEEVLPSIRATGSYYQHRRPPSPEITAERRVNLVKTGLEIMDRLGGLDERDRMMFRDITRKLILDGAAETENETREVTVSEGWLEIFGTPFPRDKYRKIGMQLKAEYLAEFEGDPPKRIQYVDGAPRQVNSYNRRWLLAALRRLTTPAPQQLQAPVEGPE